MIKFEFEDIESVAQWIHDNPKNEFTQQVIYMLVSWAETVGYAKGLEMALKAKGCEAREGK